MQFWDELINPRQTYTLDDLYKMLDKKEALKVAMSQVAKLSPQDRYDLGQEILYSNDKETFQAIRDSHYQFLSQYSLQDLKDTLASKDTSLQVKEMIKNYFAMKDKADKVINTQFQNIENGYANSGATKTTRRQTNVCGKSS